MANQNVFEAFRDAAVWKIRSWDELKSMSYFTMANYGNFFMIIFFVLFAIFQAKRQVKKIRDMKAKQAFIPAPGFPDIEPLPDFNWQDTEPIKLRPFKPKYHLTMDSLNDQTALETLDPSELIPMDKTYLERINYRRGILKDPKKRPETINVDPKSSDAIYPAIAELYTYLFTHYLPVRYPKMFKIHHTDYEYGKEVMLENKVTGTLVPAKSKGGDGRSLKAERMLETMALMVDEDFLLLIPEDTITGTDSANKVKTPAATGTGNTTPSAREPPSLRERKQPSKAKTTPSEATQPTSLKATALSSPTTPSTPLPSSPYILSAYSTLYPNGFRPSAKLGHPLRQIHSPVPGYDEKLAGSMDKFFAKIEVGRYVKRANWSVMTGGEGGELFAAPMEDDDEKGGMAMHAYEGEEVKELETIVPEETYIRCERQTLHRLPHTKALVFAFKTYLYPISEIKAEPESAAALIEAIDGLKKGNAPQMHFYKRGGAWGEAVKKYLRS